ncbi:MAG: hypothetical protein OEZ68_01925 [Gammaproteobacteria bacterium]|nr:hypothetical protein [Gammaproteobacteria bacterium]MDH5799539.1 hypothetical protein [Gammaproteobacteria bacterium]
MRTCILFVLVMALTSPVWSADNVAYCTKLLKISEIESACDKNNLTVSHPKYVEHFACALAYATKGSDESKLQLMEPSTISTSAQAVSSFEILMTGKEISGIGDRSALDSRKDIFGTSDSIHIQAGKHYLYLESNSFCSVDGLKKLASIAVSRLPK